jgi:hypothetical protein
MVACVHRLLDSDKLFPSGPRRLWPLWSGCHGDFKAAACWTTKRIWVLHDIFFFEAKVLHDLYKNGIRIETVSIGGSFFFYLYRRFHKPSVWKASKSGVIRLLA